MEAASPSSLQAETDPTAKEADLEIEAGVQELSAEVQKALPSKKSRGVFLTAGATAAAAASLFLLRKIDRKHKKKP